MTASIAKLTEPKLRAWILARVRGEEADPPVDETRLEGPDDFIKLIHTQTEDAKLRARIERASIAALGEAAKGDLRAGPDAVALRNLAALADGLTLTAAEPLLREIALRGALGGNDNALDPDAEALLLFALAGLQAKGTLFQAWLALWNRDVPSLWPVVSAGLRLSDPKKALAILPKAVERGARHDDFPLGEVLWAFAADEHYEAADIAGALKGLSDAQRAKCREALEELGATPEEMDAWLHKPAAPTWWQRNLNILKPPRFADLIAC